jgi:hypothetical protein
VLRNALKLVALVAAVTIASAAVSAALEPAIRALFIKLGIGHHRIDRAPRAKWWESDPFPLVPCPPGPPGKPRYECFDSVNPRKP